jgi:acyl-CoA synthetase (NDP forming)
MRRFCVLVVAVLGVSLMTACSSSSPPTAANFCSTLAQQKAKYLSSYGNPSGNGLEDLVQAISALGQWVPIFEALQQNSPPDIEPQVANIVDSLKQEQQDAGGSSVLGSLFSGLMTSLESSGSWEQVSEYAAEHCGSGSAS